MCVCVCVCVCVTCVRRPWRPCVNGPGDPRVNNCVSRDAHGRIPGVRVKGE